MLKRSVALLVAFVVLASGACGDDDKGSGAEKKDGKGVTHAHGGSEHTHDAGGPSREELMKLSIEMRGDLEITIKDREVPMQYLLSEAQQGIPEVFGVQPLAPVREGGVAVLPGVAVVDWKGDKKYTIEAGSPEDDAAKIQADPKKANAGGGINSSVRVEWFPTDGEAVYFQKREKPCTVEVEDDGLKGHLRCPRLTQPGSGDKYFSLDMRWEKV